MEFPDGVVVEILVRLPVKSLLRFRSVSKPWRYLIDSDRFIKAHLAASIERPFSVDTQRVFMQRIDESLRLHIGHCSLRAILEKPKSDLFDSIPEFVDAGFPMEYDSHTDVFGLGNGILCIGKVYPYFSCCLWNPATKEIKTLCRPLVMGTGMYIHIVGSGFDEVNQDYKVLVIAVPEDSALRLYAAKQTYVYSLRHDCWKRVCCGGPLDMEHYNACDEAVYLKGKLYSLRNAETYVYHGQKYEIVCFDLASETQRIIELPRIFQRRILGYVHAFGELLFAANHLVENHAYEFWFLNPDEEGGCWKRSFRVFQDGSYWQISKAVWLGLNGFTQYMTDWDSWVYDDVVSDCDDQMVLRNFSEFYTERKWVESLVPLNKQGKKKKKRKWDVVGDPITQPMG